MWLGIRWQEPDVCRPMWWCWQPLWIVALFTLPALQAEEPSYAIKGGQIKHLQGTKDDSINATASSGNETSGTEAPQNTSRLWERWWVTEKIPLYTTKGSRVENKTSRLLRPTVTITSVNGTCNITLRCTVTGGGPVNYTWFGSETRETLSTEPTLRITHRPLEGSLDYTCVVWNEESENTTMVSVADHCHDSPTLAQSTLGTYTKYFIPLLVVLLLLILLFCMYRRKNGIRGNHSRTVSINESSDSDEDSYTAAAQRNFPPEAFMPISEDPLETMEAFTSCKDDDIVETKDQPPSQE